MTAPYDQRAENVAADLAARERDLNASRAASGAAEEQIRQDREDAEQAAEACRTKNAARIAEIDAQLASAADLRRERTALAAEGYARHHLLASYRAQLAELLAQREVTPRVYARMPGTTLLAPDPLDEQIQRLRSKIEAPPL
jgi:hypothetical protein